MTNLARIIDDLGILKAQIADLKAQEDARDIIDQAKAQAKRIVEEAEKRSAEPQKAGGETRAA